MSDEETKGHAKAEIDRALNRAADANVGRLAGKLAESYSGQDPAQHPKLERNAKDAVKTIEVFANIHETGSHPPSGGGTSNDGGTGSDCIP